MKERVELSKTLKPHWVCAIALGSSIGWGCFVLPGDWLAQAGTFGTIIGFLIGALLMMTIAFAYGVMIKNFPVSGGEFAYAYIGFGRNHAFVCGWFLTLGYLCIVALNASALALLFKFTLPGIAQRGLMYNIAGWNVYFAEVLIATIALILTAYVNIKGTKISGKVQFYMCIGFLIGAIFLAVATIIHPSTVFSDLEPFFTPGMTPIAAILSIVAIAPWAYVGFDNVPQAAEEFDFSPQKAFMLIIVALFFAAIMYSLMIVATAISTPWDVIVAKKSIWVTGDSISSYLGSIGLLILAISLLLGIGTGLNGFYISSSRLLFAMGRAKILPDWFIRIHPKYGTPANGIIFTCVVCLLAPWFGREVLLWIVEMSSTGVTIAYFYCCFTAYKFLKWSNVSSSGDLAVEVNPIGKFFSLIGILASISFMILLLVPGMPAFIGLPSWIALAIWIILGIGFYLVRHNEYQRIPKEEIDYLILGDTRKNVKKSVWIENTSKNISK